jgi:DNA-binding GntR family transcriptional regulator
LILSGELATGTHIRQDDIAAELGVSRIPVREAIIALDREGWLSFESNRGAYVTGLDVDDIRDHYELRGLVFGLLARRLTEVAGDGDVKALVALHRAMRAAPDVAAFAAANDRFIATLLKLADSPRLTAALLVVPAIIHEGFFEFVPGGRTVQQDGIGAFLKALKRRSADAADKALLSMLRRQGAGVEAAFAAAGVTARSG